MICTYFKHSKSHLGYYRSEVCQTTYWRINLDKDDQKLAKEGNGTNFDLKNERKMTRLKIIV